MIVKNVAKRIAVFSLSFMLVIAQALCFPALSVHAAAISKGYVYNVSGSNATIVGCTAPSGDVAIPSSLDGYTVTSIGAGVFSGCYSVTSVTVPDTVTSIGSNAFAGCSSLASINIPASVTSIGTNAFFGCTNLSGMNVSSMNPAYTGEGGVLYNKLKTSLLAYPSAKGEISVPAGVTSIGTSAFDGCSALTGVILPDGLTAIDRTAFAGCTGLTSINVPDSVTSIGDSAFTYCSSLASLSMGIGVSSVGSKAFSNCSSLSIMYIYPEVASAAAADAFSNVPASAILYIPADASGYDSLPWNQFQQHAILGPISVYAGPNRYATAVEVSKYSYTSADTVILATGINFPDALAAGPLAIQEDAPILMTETNSIPQSTLTELLRLKARRVIIMGGETVVGPAVASTLSNLGISVERVAGSNRFGTAVETAKKVRAKSGITDSAVLAYGWNFPDALAIGSYASKEGLPILLTDTASLTEATKAALMEFGIKNVEIVGSYSVISLQVEKQLADMGIKVTRDYGTDRFSTSVKLAGKMFADSQKAVAVYGWNFPDALAAVPLAAKSNSPVLLVDQNSVPSEVCSYISGSHINSITCVGGDSVIGSEVKNELANIIK